MTVWEHVPWQGLVDRLGWMLVHSVWQVLAVALVAAAALRALRSAGPQARYAVACAALAFCAGLPALTFAIRVSPASADAPEAPAPRRVAPDRNDVVAVSTLDSQSTVPAEVGIAVANAARPALAARLEALLPWLVAAWAAGVLALSVRLGGGWLLVQRLKVAGVRAVGGAWPEAFARLATRIGVGRSVVLLESALAEVPMVVGWLRPVVLVPASALTGLEPALLEAILAHELAHVQRHDYLVNLLQSVVETLLFYHPAVWWLGRRIRAEREHCCDDVAVRACGDRLRYARALAALEELRAARPLLAPAASGGSLLARIQRLLTGAPPAGRPAGGLASLAALAIVAAVGAALVLPATAQSARADDGPTVAIEGDVLGADGAPAPDVQVLFSMRAESNEGWGRVVARTRSGAAGRFTLRVPADARRKAEAHWGALWAYRPGSLVATRRVLPGNLPPGLGVRLALGPPAGARFRVVDPDGRPVAGARIMPRVLTRDSLSVPDELGALIERESVTGADGRAVVTAFFPDEISTALVTARGFGTQQFGFGHRDIDAETKTLRLLAVGGLKGRIVGEDAAACRNRPLTISIWNTARRPPPAPALYYVTTDADGRFAIPEIAEGNLNVGSLMQPGSPWYVLAPPGLKIAPGQTLEAEIPLQKGVHATGSIREKGSGRPIAGVGVALSHGAGVTAHTDADGRFEGFMIPGSSGQVMLSSIPEGYASLLYAGPEVQVPKDAERVEVPPIDLSPAGALRGIVTRADGRPVPGARISAAWTVDEGPNRQGRRDAEVVSGPDGAFTVPRAPLGVEVRLTARAGRGRTREPVAARADDQTPVRLTLVAARTAALSGRVTDERGRPVPGATLHLRTRRLHENGQVKEAVLVDFDGATVLQADAAGRFQTPARLDPEDEYAAWAEADGFEGAHTAWVKGKAGTLADVVLKAQRDTESVVEGRVRDRQERPVGAATVWVSGTGNESSRVQTDGDGRFRLERVAPGSALLFVECAGFRFHGQAFDVARGPVEVTLVRKDEPASHALATFAPACRRDEELALARRVLDHYADQVVREGDESDRFRVLQVYASVAPGRALEALEDHPFQTGWMADAIRVDAAKALRERSPEEADAVAESIANPERRAQYEVAACDAEPPNERAARTKRLDRALRSARAIQDPAHRVVQLARIAEHWIDLGDVAKGTALLREAEPAARAMPATGWEGYARGAFAEELSQIDPAAAVALVVDVDAAPPLRDRHRLNVAQELASRDAAEAERVLDRLKEPESLVRALSRIAHAMASKDLARARRLLDRADVPGREHDAMPFAKAHALGMMALAVADHDAPAARELLDETLAELARRAADGRQGFFGLQDAATVTAALLPVVERVDRARLPEWFWRAASFRDVAPRSDNRRPARTDVVLACFLARYDRDAARVLFDPIAARGLAGPNLDTNAAVWAAAAIDPRRAVILVEAMPDDPDAKLGPFRHPKNNARLTLAAVLARSPEERWDAAAQKLLQLWTVGREDVF